MKRFASCVLDGEGSSRTPWAPDCPIFNIALLGLIPDDFARSVSPRLRRDFHGMPARLTSGFPFMLTRLVVRTVGFCVDNAWAVAAVGLVMLRRRGFHTATHFQINSNIDALLPRNLAWRQNEIAFETAFRRFDAVEVVVEAPTPELAGAATTELTQALARDKEFRAVSNPSGFDFFARNGLLFNRRMRLQRNLDGLNQAEPMIHDLATDRSLAWVDAVAGRCAARPSVRSAEARRFRQTSESRVRRLESVSRERTRTSPGAHWRKAKPAAPNELRGFVEVRPALDYGALCSRGQKAIEFGP